jgi:hypothetical protein
MIDSSSSESERRERMLFFLFADVAWVVVAAGAFENGGRGCDLQVLCW